MAKATTKKFVSIMATGIIVLIFGTGVAYGFGQDLSKGSIYTVTSVTGSGATMEFACINGYGEKRVFHLTDVDGMIGEVGQKVTFDIDGTVIPK